MANGGKHSRPLYHCLCTVCLQLSNTVWTHPQGHLDSTYKAQIPRLSSPLPSYPHSTYKGTTVPILCVTLVGFLIRIYKHIHVCLYEKHTILIAQQVSFFTYALEIPPGRRREVHHRLFTRLYGIYLSLSELISCLWMDIWAIRRVFMFKLYNSWVSWICCLMHTCAHCSGAFNERCNRGFGDIHLFSSFKF